MKSPLWLHVEAQQTLELRKSYFYPCTQHFYRRPPLLVRGRGQYVYDSEGKTYTDFFAGVSVMSCGHSNEEIVEATISQLRELQHTCTIYLTEANARLAERLAQVMPGDLNRSFFCSSGSEANEGALLLARIHTGRRGFISLEHSLHGRTYLTMSVTGLRMWRADDYLGGEDVTFIPRPYDESLSAEEAAQRSLAALRGVLEERGEEIAAMIVEPIQGNGGIIVPPSWYFREVKALLERYGVLLICDEIQTGFGRTGRMFAIEHYGVVPDIMTMAKALGNGTPISAFATTDAIAASLNRPSASTFGGNPVSAATALAVLDFIESQRLAERAQALGGLLKAGLLKLQTVHPGIAHVRGMGLMIGMELDYGDAGVSAAKVDELLERMKDRGFLIGKNGVHRNVVAFQPPLVITEQDIHDMTEALERTLHEIGE
ncbi:aspartate aminotransferase family protein [Paenibacillus sp. 598K]|uniref:aspartate aminotransferase family protein n=1 Tax=Paenibacillus sp. 598K TaxID=1117987 RepID=UPI000FFA60D2|nr:aspartate aminotransferase family protein [Paenibacillus sp. 598K]GBF76461.1 aspartate aminotransferase family protein [Paenibacillus sp. 598K]